MQFRLLTLFLLTAVIAGLAWVETTSPGLGVAMGIVAMTFVGLAVLEKKGAVGCSAAYGLFMFSLLLLLYLYVLR